MNSIMRKSWRRLQQMSWDELRTRSRQEIHQRLEFAIYHTGLPREKPWKGLSDEAGKFFFCADDLPILANLIRTHLNDKDVEIVREADEICNHRFRLLGYEKIDYGPKIDWHRDAVHGKKAPLAAWYKIPFLDFSVVGDHKVTWELNRHQHLVILAKAWVLSRAEKYIAELLHQWYDWQLANPFLVGINWASSLEVSFRSISWLWVRSLLAGCPSVPSSFEQDLLKALALHARYIERYLSTYFSPNTHLLGEAAALFFIGTMCPQLPAAKRWQSLGWNVILHEAKRQVREDGVYFEQSLYYHVYALDFLLHTRTLAARNGINIPAALDNTLRSLLEVVQAISQSNPPQGFGDDDGGRVFDPRRNRSQHLIDPLAVGAVLFESSELRSVASLTEEAIWLFGRQAVTAFAGPFVPPTRRSACFEAAGVYVMAGPAENEQLVIERGPRNSGRGGHAHADSLSVTVSWRGRPWLIDPGTYCYVCAGKDREQFRGTAAHNTLMVDGSNQAAADGHFAWAAMPAVRTDKWIAGETFSLFLGNHTGYEHLRDPVLHRRLVFHLHGRFWLVQDQILGKEDHRVDCSWHFAPDLVVQGHGNTCVAATPGDGDVIERLALIFSAGPNWSWKLGSAEASPVYGKKERTSVLRISAQTKLPAVCATVIKPFFRSLGKPGKLSALGDSAFNLGSPVLGYHYEEEDCVHHMIFSDSGKSWTACEWNSDACVIYCCFHRGKLKQFVLCGGSFANLRDRPIFMHSQNVERFEWAEEHGKEQLWTSAEGSAPVLFREMVSS
jgi:hypothetical protein